MRTYNPDYEDSRNRSIMETMIHQAGKEFPIGLVLFDEQGKPSAKVKGVAKLITDKKLVRITPEGDDSFDLDEPDVSRRLLDYR